MNPIALQDSFAPASYGAFPADSSYQAEQTRAGSLSQKQGAELTITTDEGDTVTLSMASAVDATAGIYRSDTYGPGTAASTRTAFFEASSSRTLNLEINGDLNAAELEDIREAVAAIGSMIEEFLAGNVQAMADDAQVLKELESIASVDAAFAYERQVVYGEADSVIECPVGRGNTGHDQGVFLLV